MAKNPKKIRLIADYRKLRESLNLNQHNFWAPVGVTQSGGSRYESGRNVPRPTAILAHRIYVQGEPIDARDYR